MKPSLATSLSQLGFGAAPIGNLYAAVSDDDAQASLHEAWQRDIRYFDTAPYYGHGLSERRLGAAFTAWPRASFTVSTKVGRRLEADNNPAPALIDGFAVSGSRAVFDYSRDGVLRSFEASLRRLGLDRIDILLLHDIGGRTHGDRHETVLRQALDEALPAMAALRDAGAVGAIGIGVNEVEVCLELLPRFDLDCILLAGRYTLLEQAPSMTLLAQAQQHGVRIIAAGPFNSGLLGSAKAPGQTFDYASVDPAALTRAQEIYALCARENVDVGAAALQFPLAHPAVVSVVAGLRSADEVKSAATRRDSVIPDRLWQRLRDEGIVLPQAPVPQA